MASRALEGDGALSGIGAATSLLALTALVLYDMLGWWWADRVTALIVAAAAAAAAWHTAPSSNDLPDARRCRGPGNAVAAFPGPRPASARTHLRPRSSLVAVHASRRRSRQAARPVRATAYPQRTANPAQGPSGCATNGWPHRAPPALEGR